MILGIAPITEANLDRTETNMEQKGLYNTKDTAKIKHIKALKLLTKMWFNRELKMTEDEWSELEITLIQQSSNLEGDIVYVTFAHADQITQVC